MDWCFTAFTVNAIAGISIVGALACIASLAIGRNLANKHKELQTRYHILEEEHNSNQRYIEILHWNAKRASTVEDGSVDPQGSSTDERDETKSDPTAE
jgi:predicted protein tyrosine phosphatase